MLWLSVHLPYLALDGLLRGRAPGQTAEPLAVCASHGPRQWIHRCNRTAARAGVAPGMSLQAARSLDSRLRVFPRDEAEERRLLENLAAWAGQFTPVRVLDPPDGLLLEIEGSLTLFGGLRPLGRRVLQGLRELGFRARWAVAPTPGGAALLARTGVARQALNREALAGALAPLPVTALADPEGTAGSLRRAGVRTLAECLRLPRDGLARRLGPALVAYLDRVLGRAPDPRTPYEPPPRFCSRLQLPRETDQAEALLFAARRQAQELAGFLLGRGAGVQTLTWKLLPAAGPAPCLQLGLATPARDAERFLGLLRERLERETLVAPVQGLELHAEQLLPLEEHSPGLFAADRPDPQSGLQLLERLRTRLGDDAICQIRPWDDPRPERAWRYGAAPGDSSRLDPPRPLWLLHQPAILKVTQGYPWLHGRLVLKEGPERIESGWWDGHDVARDYFVAENERHERFWVFRELRKPHRWFLHGVFG